jgi:hypothetical protein
MSLLPDTREEAEILVPASAHEPLKAALMMLYQKHPSYFRFTPRYRSSLWDAEFVLTEAGQAFLAGEIMRTLEQ